MPHGTESSLKYVSCSVPIPILGMPTMMTSMRPGTQRLLDDLPTIGRILARVVRWNGNRDHTKHFSKVLNPFPELSPRCIRNGFSKVSIPHHVSHLQVLIGYQVVRLDYAPRVFTAKSLRCLLTLRCALASLFLNLALFLEPFLVLDKRRCSRFKDFSDLRR